MSVDLDYIDADNDRMEDVEFESDNLMLDEGELAPCWDHTKYSSGCSDAIKQLYSADQAKPVGKSVSQMTAAEYEVAREEVQKKCPHIRMYPEDDRVFAFPVPAVRAGLHKYFDAASNAYWKHSEIDLTRDLSHHNAASPEIQEGVNMINTFFAAGDKLINVNIIARLRSEFPVLEAEWFYNFQLATEDTHAMTYSQIINVINTDPLKQQQILSGFATIPAIRKMTDYIKRTADDSTLSIKHVLVRSAIAEGLFFYGPFAFIFWLAKNGLYPGLSQANAFISRDEGLHAVFSIIMYLLCAEWTGDIPRDELVEMFKEGAEIAQDFARIVVPTPMAFMNSDLLCAYLEYQCDFLFEMVTSERVYGTENPFDFMDALLMELKTNFFEAQVTNYAKPCADELGEVW